MDWIRTLKFAADGEDLGTMLCRASRHRVGEPPESGLGKDRVYRSVVLINLPVGSNPGTPVIKSNIAVENCDATYDGVKFGFTWFKNRNESFRQMHVIVQNFDLNDSVGKSF